jgi:hypothetical protein
MAELLNYNGDKRKIEFRCKNNAWTYESNSKLRWPVQAMPCISTFNIWYNYVKQVTKSDNNGRLPKPLGNWYDNPASVIQIKYW